MHIQKPAVKTPGGRGSAFSAVLPLAVMALLAALLAALLFTGCPDDKIFGYVNTTIDNGGGGSDMVPPPDLPYNPPVWSYRISFDMEPGATFNGDPADPPDQLIAGGGTAVNPGDAACEGKTFSGWFWGHLQWDFDTPVERDMLLVARFDIITYTVAFDAQGGSPVPPSQTIAAGGTAVEPVQPAQTGYTFGGWYKDAACTQEWDFATTTVAANTTLYAKWTLKSYTVSFFLNGGEYPSAYITEIAAQTVGHGLTVTEPAHDPTNPSFTTFSGWYNGAALWSFSNPVTGDMTLTAEWNVPSFTYNTPAPVTVNGVTAEVDLDKSGASPGQVGGTTITATVNFSSDPSGAEKAGTFSAALTSATGDIARPVQTFTVTMSQNTFSPLTFTFIVPRAHITDLTLTVTFAEAVIPYYKWQDWMSSTSSLAPQTKPLSAFTGIISDNASASTVLGGSPGPGAGWYLVSGNAAYTGDVNFSGGVSLILQDGCALTINGTVTIGGWLDIYGQGQDGGSGRLTVNAQAGNNAMQGNTFIHGGTITLRGGDGPGSDKTKGCGFFGPLHIFSGRLDASGGADGAGGGIVNNSGYVSCLWGGTVNARSFGTGPGIGSTGSGTVEIKNPVIVNAWGGKGSAGIGSGRGEDLREIIIDNGAQVTAYGGAGEFGGGAGIGSGGAASLGGNSGSYRGSPLGSIQIPSNPSTRIIARGGAGTASNAGGGAGIGTGGADNGNAGDADVYISPGNTTTATLILQGGAGHGYGTAGEVMGKGGSNSVVYYEWDNSSSALIQKTKSRGDVVRITSSIDWSDPKKWFVTESADLTINTNVSLGNDINIILKNGTTLRINGSLSSGTGLKIYGQGADGGTGALVVNRTTTQDTDIDGAYSCASGPGGIEFHGGRLTFTATSRNLSGIWVGAYGGLTVYGGVVTVTGGAAGGQGGGIVLDSGNPFTVNGGTVNATSNGAGAGLGGRGYTDAPNITINGGTVNAWGGEGSAAIGTGLSNTAAPCTLGTITVNGGTVKAWGGSGAIGGGAGIGTAGASAACPVSGGTAGKITINGGSVSAWGGPATANYAGGGAGIGSGGVASTNQSDAGSPPGTTGSGSFSATGGLGHGNGTTGAGVGQGGYNKQGPAVYYEASWVSGQVEWVPKTTLPGQYKVYDASTGHLTENRLLSGWYLFRGTWSRGSGINKNFTVNGVEANIILENGCDVTVLDSIWLEGSGAKLNIYSQTPGYVQGMTGKLAARSITGGATNREINIHCGEITSTVTTGPGVVETGAGEFAAIHVPPDGTLTIYGGKISAKAPDRGAGIGGQYYLGFRNACGTVIIYGGEVTAQGGTGYAAGIGGAAQVSYQDGPGNGGNVKIYGGTVTATADQGAGIGKGLGSEGGRLEIHGGKVTATSAQGHGIGGINATVIITGGTVIANITGGSGNGIYIDNGGSLTVDPAAAPGDAPAVRNGPVVVAKSISAGPRIFNKGVLLNGASGQMKGGDIGLGHDITLLDVGPTTLESIPGNNNRLWFMDHSITLSSDLTLTGTNGWFVGGGTIFRGSYALTWAGIGNDTPPVTVTPP